MFASTRSLVQQHTPYVDRMHAEFAERSLSRRCLAKKPKKTKFKLNDLVRLTTYKRKFDKSYFESFSRELFGIREIHVDDSPF